MLRRLALAALVFSAVPAMAAPGCLKMVNLYSWHELGRHAVILENVGHRKFKVDYSGYCGNLKYAMSIGVKSQSPSDLSCLQRGDILLTHTANQNYRCVVEDISPYTPKAQTP